MHATPAVQAHGVLAYDYAIEARGISILERAEVRLDTDIELLK